MSADGSIIFCTPQQFLNNDMKNKVLLAMTLDFASVQDYFMSYKVKPRSQVSCHVYWNFNRFINFTGVTKLDLNADQCVYEFIIYLFVLPLFQQLYWTLDRNGCDSQNRFLPFLYLAIFYTCIDIYNIQNAHAYISCAIWMKLDPGQAYRVLERPRIVYTGINGNMVSGVICIWQVNLNILWKYICDAEIWSCIFEKKTMF